MSTLGSSPLIFSQPLQLTMPNITSCNSSILGGNKDILGLHPFEEKERVKYSRDSTLHGLQDFE